MCWQAGSRFQESLSAESGAPRSLWPLLTLLQLRLLLSAALSCLKTALRSDPRLCSLPAEQGSKELQHRQHERAEWKVAAPDAVSGVDG
jgi:hypothetical protein